MIITGLDLSINSPGCVKLYLDDNFIPEDIKYLGFNSVKKYTNDNILHYRKKDFRNNYEQLAFMKSEILDFVNGSKYIGLEGYSFGSVGRVFDLAEYSGILKHDIYLRYHKMRIFPPTSIKMFSTSSGNANKVAMQKAYDEYVLKNKGAKDIIDLNWLDNFVSPKADIIDAWWIARMLCTELALRENKLDINKLNDKQKQAFIKTTKSSPVNVLNSEFLYKGII